MKFWIKKRMNPQVDQPYFIGLGQMSAKDAKRHEQSIYGTSEVYSLDTEASYERELKLLEHVGFSVTRSKP